MIRKRKVILDIYKDKKTNFLEAATILRALEKRGYNFSKRQLSNFIRNSLEQRYLVPLRDASGTIVGWALIRSI